jgi:hypothetical protein
MPEMGRAPHTYSLKVDSSIHISIDTHRLIRFLKCMRIGSSTSSNDICASTIIPTSFYCRASLMRIISTIRGMRTHAMHCRLARHTWPLYVQLASCCSSIMRIPDMNMDVLHWCNDMKPSSQNTHVFKIGVVTWTVTDLFITMTRNYAMSCMPIHCMMLWILLIAWS